MRMATLKSTDGLVMLDLGYDIDIICGVMEIGRYIPDLIYEVELSSEETIDFLRKFKINDEIISKIDKDKKYIIRAYDW